MRSSPPAIIGCLALSLLCSAPGAASEPAEIEIVGTLGLAESLEHSCLAVWVPVDDASALAGIAWYNNDGTVPFPAVLVQSGRSDYPVALADALPVAQQVSGASAGWSELTFSEPMAASGKGLYVILQVPTGAVASFTGAGGGPALGYTDAQSGLPGWLSADGEDWVRVQASHGFAVVPRYVPRTAGMAVKSGSGNPSPDSALRAAPAVSVLGSAVPNPFNPRTALRFTIAVDGPVELAIFNVRGERVRTLIASAMEVGSHEAVWDGCDAAGAPQASGVYVARLSAGGVLATRRLILVR